MSQSASILTATEASTMLWDIMGSSPTSATWCLCVSVVIQAIVVSMIVAKTVDYYESYTGVDSVYVLEAVAVGVTVSIAALALRLIEAYKLVKHGADDAAGVMRFVVYAEFAYILVGSIFNVVTGSWYVWRAYKMSYKVRYIVPLLGLAMLAQLVMAFTASITAFTMRSFALNDITDVISSLSHAQKYFRAWGAVTLGVDGAICVFMTYILLHTQQGMFRNHRRVLKTMIALLWETMLPPVICLIVLETQYGQKEYQLRIDWTFTFIGAVPVLYLHSALHTLVGRKTVRRVLAAELIDQGGSEILSGRRSRHSSGVGTAQYSETRSEVWQYADNLASEPGSALPFTAPLVKVEHTVVTSEPDDYLKSDVAPTLLHETTANGRPKFAGWSA